MMRSDRNAVPSSSQTTFRMATIELPLSSNNSVCRRPSRILSIAWRGAASTATMRSLLSVTLVKRVSTVSLLYMSLRDPTGTRFPVVNSFIFHCMSGDTANSSHCEIVICASRAWLMTCWVIAGFLHGDWKWNCGSLDRGGGLTGCDTAGTGFGAGFVMTTLGFLPHRGPFFAISMASI